MLETTTKGRPVFYWDARVAWRVSFRTKAMSSKSRNTSTHPPHTYTILECWEVTAMLFMKYSHSRLESRLESYPEHDRSIRIIGPKVLQEEIPRWVSKCVGYRERNVAQGRGLTAIVCYLLHSSPAIADRGSQLKYMFLYESYLSICSAVRGRDKIFYKRNHEEKQHLLSRPYMKVA